ncbi:hypothetical protein RHSIM_Rhsim11G0188800 [Rhododendron simsii]|uniref:NADP-dependent oxidoreductase domain-containing protein n=1 Tax=Rhododendron simsii TaxID=118357 RepID=A0A834LAU6_RHOSS|nr:hypothetical protein RHSIM_Rhsim11G0188800 [Rhododendron simsii]
MVRRATTDRRAIKSSITFLDTSDCYGPNANEVLLALCVCTFHLLIYWLAALIFPTASSTTMYSRNKGLTSIGGHHQNFKLAFRWQKGKRLFNTRLPHPPPTPPLTLPLLKDKEPPLAAVGPSSSDHRHHPITGIIPSPPWSDSAPLLFCPPSPLAKSRQR